MNNYDDITNLPHHISATRPQMSMIDRAAQFSPFAALVGYDAAIKETGRLTDVEIEPDDAPEVQIAYFISNITAVQAFLFVSYSKNLKLFLSFRRIVLINRRIEHIIDTGSL